MVPAVLGIGLSGLHQVILKLRYAAVKQQALAVQDAVKVSLVSTFGHPQLDLQVLDLTSSFEESAQLVGQELTMRMVARMKRET